MIVGYVANIINPPSIMLHNKLCLLGMTLVQPAVRFKMESNPNNLKKNLSEVYVKVEHQFDIQLYRSTKILTITYWTP